MRWRFGNAFNWYNVLVDETDKHVDGIITTARNPTDEKEPHSGGGLTALTECAAPLGDGQQKCGPH